MTSSSPPPDRQTRFGRLSDLPLGAESYALEALRRRWSAEFVRRSTVVWLFEAAGTTPPLAGRSTRWSA